MNEKIAKMGGRMTNSIMFEAFEEVSYYDNQIVSG